MIGVAQAGRHKDALPVGAHPAEVLRMGTHLGSHRDLRLLQLHEKVMSLRDVPPAVRGARQILVRVTHRAMMWRQQMAVCHHHCLQARRGC